MDNLVDTAVDAGIIVGEPKLIEGGGGYTVLPDSAKIHDLERFLPKPAYAKGEVKARTVDALTAYVTRHKTDDTAVFADVEAGKVHAVIDWLSAKNEPAHAAHSVVYTAPLSLEWQRWNAINGKQMAQADFARFIEENREDVVTPDGATMLELAKTLDAKSKVTFKSSVRLDNGNTDLAFKDETTASGGIDGKVAIPNEIEIGIPVFYGGDRYKIKALFRYRIVDGKLVLWIDLHRIKHVRDAAFGDVIEAVKNGCDGVPVYEASVS